MSKYWKSRREREQSEKKEKLDICFNCKKKCNPGELSEDNLCVECDHLSFHGE